jgi:hypothetical protein
MLQIGPREEIIAVNRLKACTTAEAAPAARAAPCGRPPGKRPGGSAAAKRVSFAQPVVSTPSTAPQRNGPGTVFRHYIGYRKKLFSDIRYPTSQFVNPQCSGKKLNISYEYCGYETSENNSISLNFTRVIWE